MCSPTRVRARKWQISTDGGTEPVWNPNGRELFYRSGNKMMAVEIATQPVFAAGRPDAALYAETTCRLPRRHPNYDVSRDGRRFLMVQPSARRECDTDPDHRRPQLVRGAEATRADEVAARFPSSGPSTDRSSVAPQLSLLLIARSLSR